MQLSACSSSAALSSAASKASQSAPGPAVRRMKVSRRRESSGVVGASADGRSGCDQHDGEHTYLPCHAMHACSNSRLHVPPSIATKPNEVFHVECWPSTAVSV